jgi:hypothetical protein
LQVFRSKLLDLNILVDANKLCTYGKESNYLSKFNCKEFIIITKEYNVYTYLNLRKINIEKLNKISDRSNIPILIKSDTTKIKYDSTSIDIIPFNPQLNFILPNKVIISISTNNDPIDRKGYIKSPNIVSLIIPHRLNYIWKDQLSKNFIEEVVSI